MKLIVCYIVQWWEEDKILWTMELEFLLNKDLNKSAHLTTTIYMYQFRKIKELTFCRWYEGIFITLDTGIIFANGPISGKHANGSLPNCPLRVLDVQSGIFKRAGQGSHEVTG